MRNEQTSNTFQATGYRLYCGNHRQRAAQGDRVLEQSHWNVRQILLFTEPSKLPACERGATAAALPRIAPVTACWRIAEQIAAPHKPPEAARNISDAAKVRSGVDLREAAWLIVLLKSEVPIG